MIKLGFALPNLSAGQLTYFLVRNANRLLRDRPDVDVTAFVESQAARPLPANFATMPLYEAWGYEAPVVATTWETARKLAAFPGKSRRLLYLWDLEWLRGHLRRPYADWAAVYRDERLAVIARGEDHRRVFEDCFNRKAAAVVEDCDVARLLEFAHA